MCGKRLVGLAILLAVVLAVAVYSLVETGTLDPLGSPAGRDGSLSLRGYIGDEKTSLLEDPEIREILERRYRIVLKAIPAGSIDMVRGDVSDVDFLWPSGQVALEIYALRGGPRVDEALIFNSPIVLYSWDIVTAALERQGLARRMEGGYYTVDVVGLVEAIRQERTWAEFGVPELYGKVTVVSTDPTRSDSGNEFAGLLAAALNGGEVVTEQTVVRHLPAIEAFYARLGFLNSSGDALFSQYLTQGVGAYPLIVGYESQLVEFSLANRQALPLIKEQTRILYPQPTVWSSHPLIAVNEDARRLIQALLDPDVQLLAWSKHGFRTAPRGAADDPDVLEVTGIPATIDMVIPMPKASVMDRIIRALEE